MKSKRHIDYFDIINNLLTITFPVCGYGKFYRASLNSKSKCNLYFKGVNIECELQDVSGQCLWQWKYLHKLVKGRSDLLAQFAWG